MAPVVWTDEARRCLQAIYEYIAEDNEPAAYRLVLAVHSKAEALEELPGSVNVLLDSWDSAPTATGRPQQRACPGGLGHNAAEGVSRLAA